MFVVRESFCLGLNYYRQGSRVDFPGGLAKILVERGKIIEEIEVETEGKQGQRTTSPPHRINLKKSK